MAYTKTTWVNGQAPAINAANLNKIELTYEDIYVSINSILAYFDNFNDRNRSFRLKKLFFTTFGFRHDNLSEFRRRNFLDL